jgi:hypothetical protein
VPPFAILVLEGFVRRPIASPVMEVLEALDGHEVALVEHPPAVAVPGSIAWPEPPPADVVRVRSGPLLGRLGRWAGLGGRRRFGGGVDLEAGLVRFDGGAPVAVPIGDLERFA